MMTGFHRLRLMWLLLAGLLCATTGTFAASEGYDGTGNEFPAANSRAYRAINPAFAESTAANGFYRSGAAGRLGNDGIYANSTIEGAVAEFAHHNPGINPAVFKVNYPASTPLRIDPPSGYFNPKSEVG